MLRTLANSVEASLSIVALFYFSKLNGKLDGNMLKMTLCISVAFVIRPSIAIGFFPLALWYIIQSWEQFRVTFLAALIVGLPIVSMSVCLDSWYYGTFTIS